MIQLTSYIETVAQALKDMQVTDSEARSVDAESALIEWCRVTKEVSKNAGIFFLSETAQAP